eukprot:TRINITY_DN20289_c0_g1_i1.p1 TRINITY_DN20289_c0_g1~~TRINITY_DN20289_c0_g1_i1.p1  ORF type:complete len:1153 (-),score=158.66 TRINITY_DN20289_c0_g1_i1:221-3679(-)
MQRSADGRHSGKAVEGAASHDSDARALAKRVEREEFEACKVLQEKVSGRIARLLKRSWEAIDVHQQQHLPKEDVVEGFSRCLTYQPDFERYEVEEPVTFLGFALFWLQVKEKVGLPENLLETELRRLLGTRCELPGVKILAAALSPDGRTVVTSTEDRLAKLWNLETGSKAANLGGHHPCYCSVAVSPDGDWVAVGQAVPQPKSRGAGLGNAVLLFNALGGYRHEWTLVGHREAVLAGSWSVDSQLLVTASADCTARVWPRSSDRCIGELVGHAAPVCSASWHPNNAHVVTSSWDKTARIWNTEKPGCPCRLLLQGHSGEVYAAIFVNNGLDVVTVSADRSVFVWDGRNGDCRTMIIAHADEICSVAASPDEQFIVTASCDGTVKVWNLQNSECLLQIGKPGEKEFYSAVFTPDGMEILTAASDGTARIFTDRGFCKRIFTGHRDRLRSAEIYDNSGADEIATSSLDGTVKIWSASSGECLFTLGSPSAINSVCWAADGRRLLTAGADHSAKMWDTYSGDLLMTFLGHTEGVAAACFSPDGRFVLTGSYDGTVRLWLAEAQAAADLPAFLQAGKLPSEFVCGDCILVLEGMIREVYAVAISQMGDYLAAGCADHLTRVWSLATGKLVHKLQGHVDEVTSIAFSTHDRHMLTGSLDGAAILWQSKTAERLETFGSQLSAAVAASRGGVRPPPVNMAVFSRDCQFVAAALGDFSAIVWSINGSQLHKLQGHEDEVIAVQFSEDSQQLFTAAWDSTLKIWQLNGIKGTRNCTLTLDTSLELPTTTSSAAGAKDQASALAATNEAVETSATAAITPLQEVEVSSIPDWAMPAQKGAFDHLLPRKGLGALMCNYATGEVSGIDVSADGMFMLLVPARGSVVQMRDMDSSQLLQSFAHSKQVYSACFRADGLVVLTACGDNSAWMWAVGDGTKLMAFPGHEGPVVAAAFSPDGFAVITASRDCTARLWHADSGRAYKVLKDHEDEIYAVNFSNDCNLVVTASWDRTARVWTVDDGAFQLLLLGHKAEVYAASFSADDSVVLTASADMTARVWGTEKGDCLAVLVGHKDEVCYCSCSPDNIWFLTTSLDGTAKVWETRSACCFLTIGSGKGRIRTACWLPDSRSILTSSSEATVQRWSVNPVADVDQRGSLQGGKPTSP